LSESWATVRNALLCFHQTIKPPIHLAVEIAGKAFNRERLSSTDFEPVSAFGAGAEAFGKDLAEFIKIIGEVTGI